MIGVFRTGVARPLTALTVAFIDDRREEYEVEPMCSVADRSVHPLRPQSLRGRVRVAPGSRAGW